MGAHTLLKLGGEIDNWFQCLMKPKNEREACFTKDNLICAQSEVNGGDSELSYHNNESSPPSETNLIFQEIPAIRSLSSIDIFR